MNHLKSWLPARGAVLFTLLIASGLVFYVHHVTANLGTTPPQLAGGLSSTHTFTYQGRLTDSTGLALTGNYPITFKLYSVASGGSELWSESWPAVDVQNGLFQVLLGSITPLTPDLVTNHNSLWLGVQVGGDAEMMPRVQLGSVPFAMQSLVVPTGAITTTMLADGAVTSAKLAPVVKMAQDDGGNLWTNNTTNFIDLPGAVITLTVDEVSTNSTLLIFFDGTFRNTSGGGTWVQVTVDESRVGMWVPTWNTNWTMVPTHQIKDISPGTHVVKAQFRTITSGTAEATNYSLIVLVVSE